MSRPNYAAQDHLFCTASHRPADENWSATKRSLVRSESTEIAQRQAMSANVKLSWNTTWDRLPRVENIKGGICDWRSITSGLFLFTRDTEDQMVVSVGPYIFQRDIAAWQQLVSEFSAAKIHHRRESSVLAFRSTGIQQHAPCCRSCLHHGSTAALHESRRTGFQLWLSGAKRLQHELQP